MIQDEKNKIQELSEKLNLNPIVVELLFSRGYKDIDSINKFLNPNLNQLHNPFLLKDMTPVVDRINKAIENKEKVLIFGDYDVDGVSATAILVKYFSSRSFYVGYYLPNRYVDGYGLTNEVLDKIKTDYAPKLIITVDCGISCYKEVEYAKSLGIDMIITDHHDIPEILPDTLVIDPKIPNQQYPFSQLCGTGVALKIVQALGGLSETKKYLSIAAIATIADIVSLTDENRIIVSCGLRVLESTLPAGIKALIKSNKLNYDLSSTDIAFKLSPKINAAGRMGDASVALKLYLEENKLIIDDTIETLNNMNLQRQALCNKVYEDAISRINNINISNYMSIVLSSKDWDAGVLGIVAAKIANEFNRPTVLFSQVGDELKGSARSVNDIDIHKTITNVKEAVETFGGHKMAAGLTIKAKNYKNFITSLNASLNKEYTLFDLVPKKEYCFDINPEQINEKLVKDLSVLEPFGIGNERPVFNLSFNKVNVVPMTNHPEHLNINSNNFSIVAFNSSKYLTLLRNTAQQNILVELQENKFKGKTYVKGIAKNISTGTIIGQKEDLLGAQYIKQLMFEDGDCLFKEYNKNDLKKLISHSNEVPFGTLFIANTYQTYNDFIRNGKATVFYNDFLTISQNNGFNTILLSPISSKSFGSFNRIIFLDALLDKSYINKISQYTKAKIYIPSDKKISKSVFAGLDATRQTFGEYFKCISALASKNVSFIDELDIYKQLKINYPNNKKFTYKQFIFCLYTFIELKIFRIEEDGDYLKIKEDGKIISTLTNSTFYNRVNFILNTMGEKC